MFFSKTEKRVKDSFSLIAIFGISFATMGASFVFVIVIANTSEIVSEDVSVAVTIMAIVPTSLLAGVPLKVRMTGVKVNQAGNISPFSSDALYIRLSFISISLCCQKNYVANNILNYRYIYNLLSRPLYYIIKKEPRHSPPQPAIAPRSRIAPQFFNVYGNPDPKS